MEPSLVKPIKSEKERKKLNEKIQEEKKTNPHPKKFAVISIIIFAAVFFLVFFGVKWVYPETPEFPTMEYNGFKFEKVGGLWHTNWQKDNKLYTISLRYNPKEVEEVPMLGAINETFNQHQIYLSFDPTANPDEFKYTALANSEISLSLVKAFGKKPIASCIRNETKACKDRPIARCEDTEKSVIIVSPNGEPAVLMKNNCIILKGKELGILKSADKLLYTWYQIMRPLPQPLDLNQLRIDYERSNTK